MMVNTTDGSFPSSHSFANFTYLVATKHFLNYTEYKKVTSTNNKLSDIHVTVHRDKFLIIKPTRCTNFSSLFLE